MPSLRTTALLGALLALAGCDFPTVVGLPAQPQFAPVRLTETDRIDVLFVLDSSPSMEEKQARFTDALTRLAPALPVASYHFGAITADLGAGAFTEDGCRPDGDGARLQTVGAAAGSGCAGTSDGRSFLSVDLTTDQNNLGAQSLARALGCMVSVGTGGCFVEQPLEAARRALLANVSTGDDDAGFLRADALLAVIFVTDQDDCSASDSALFDPAASDLGPLDSYRCVRAGLRIGQPARALPTAPSGGPLPMPSADEQPTMLYPPSRYRDLYTLPLGLGGLKRDANDVLLMAIAGPTEPFELIATPPLREPGADQPACTLVADAESATCALALRHSCAASSDARLFGDPAVRLTNVVSAAVHHYLAPICAADQSVALADFVAQLSAQQAGTGCLAAPLADPAHPQCEVLELAPSGDGKTVISSLPACAASQPTLPCWHIVSDPRCAPLTDASGSVSRERLAIERAEPAPAGSTLSARCATGSVALDGSTP